MTDHSNRAQQFLGAGDGRVDKLAELFTEVERKAYERAEQLCRELESKAARMGAESDWQEKKARCFGETADAIAKLRSNYTD